MSLKRNSQKPAKKLDKSSNARIVRRIDILAKALIWLSAIWFALTTLEFALDPTSLSSSSSQNNPIFDAIVMCIQLSIGIGLLKRQVWAYYAFRVFGVLALIGAIFMILAFAAFLPYIISLFANMNSLIAIAGMFGLGLNIVIFGFWIYGLFVTDTPAARKLFR